MDLDRDREILACPADSGWAGLFIRTIAPWAIALLVVGVALFFALARFVELSDTAHSESQRDTFTYSSRGVDVATVHLDAGVGRLDVSVSDDADALIVADVVWDARVDRPVFAAETSSGEAIVRLRTQRSSWVTVPGRWDQRWRVSLGQQIPMRLRVNGGVNVVNLDLRELTIDDVDVDLGIGEATVVLAEGDYRVTIDGGIGSLVIEVPDGVQARMGLSGGLGSMNVSSRFQRDGAHYVTESWEPDRPTVEVDVDGGIGTIHVK